MVACFNTQKIHISNNGKEKILNFNFRKNDIFIKEIKFFISKVKSKIILTPQHAKRLTKALLDNVNRFENANGAIKDYEQPPIPMNFGPTGEA